MEILQFNPAAWHLAPDKGAHDPNLSLSEVCARQELQFVLCLKEFERSRTDHHRDERAYQKLDYGHAGFASNSGPHRLCHLEVIPLH